MFSSLSKLHRKHDFVLCGIVVTTLFGPHLFTFEYFRIQNVCDFRLCSFWWFFSYLVSFWSSDSNKISQKYHWATALRNTLRIYLQFLNLSSVSCDSIKRICQINASQMHIFWLILQMLLIKGDIRRRNIHLIWFAGSGKHVLIYRYQKTVFSVTVSLYNDFENSIGIHTFELTDSHKEQCDSIRGLIKMLQWTFNNHNKTTNGYLDQGFFTHIHTYINILKWLTNVFPHNIQLNLRLGNFVFSVRVQACASLPVRSFIHPLAHFIFGFSLDLALVFCCHRSLRWHRLCRVSFDT